MLKNNTALKILEKTMTEENIFDREKLSQSIRKASTRYDKLKRLNQSLSIGIGLFGISLSLGATISGIIFPDNSKIAAIFGACAATTQAILFAYPTDKRSRVYRTLFARNENLRTELEVRPQTDQELQAILDEFKSIRVQAASEEAIPKKSENPQELETNSENNNNRQASTPDKQPGENLSNLVSSK
jgi:hypothetical protein